MKKLFTNYTFSFDSTERKLLKTFCKQTLKQIEGDNKYFSEIRSFNSILSKLESENDEIKLTKDERTKLKFMLEQNAKYLSDQVKKSWFIKKWMYKSLSNQYNNLLSKHF